MDELDLHSLRGAIAALGVWPDALLLHSRDVNQMIARAEQERLAVQGKRYQEKSAEADEGKRPQICGLPVYRTKDIEQGDIRPLYFEPTASTDLQPTTP